MKTTTISGRGTCTGCRHEIALNKDGTVRRHRTAADAWCSGSREVPAPDVEVDPRRVQWIADARALIDFIEANPELPLNTHSGIGVSYHPMPGDLDDADKKAAVDAVANMLGVAVTPPGPGSHYEVQKTFGSATYKAVAVLKDYSDRYYAIQELGEAALADREAARPVEYVDYAEAEDVRETEREMAVEAGDDSEIDRQVAEDDARSERCYEAHQANEAWLDAHPDEFVNDNNEDGAL